MFRMQSDEGNNRVWDVDDNHSASRTALVLLMPVCLRLLVMKVENLMANTRTN